MHRRFLILLLLVGIALLSMIALDLSRFHAARADAPASRPAPGSAGGGDVGGSGDGVSTVGSDITGTIGFGPGDSGGSGGGAK